MTMKPSANASLNLIFMSAGTESGRETQLDGDAQPVKTTYYVQPAGSDGGTKGTFQSVKISHDEENNETTKTTINGFQFGGSFILGWQLTIGYIQTTK